MAKARWITSNYRWRDEPLSTTPICTVIIPVHGGKAHLPVFWRSLIDTRPDHCQIVIVDDGCDFDIRDVSAGLEQQPDVIVKRNEQPKGYAAAVNAGIAASKGHCILLLNSDLILLPNCLKQLVDAILEDPTIGVVSATLLFPQTGRVQHAGLLFTETNHYHLFSGLPGDSPLLDRVRDLQAVAFALVCLRRSIIEEIGLLDERYFNGYEDIDYCFRLSRNGYRIVVLGDAKALHWERQSGPRRRIWRKDNVARLWRDWGVHIKPDLCRFHAESWEQIALVHPHISRKEFTIVELYGAPQQDKSNLILCSTGIMIVDSWDYCQGSADYLWLPMILPVSAVQHERPFLYVVENITDLYENQYWFSLRRNYCASELIADYCGNLITTDGGGL